MKKIHIKSIELMEVLSRSVFEYIIQHYDIEKNNHFAGQGNNGGDVLASSFVTHSRLFNQSITVFYRIIYQMIVKQTIKHYLIKYTYLPL